MEVDVPLGNTDDLGLQDVFEIVLDHLESDRFRTPENAEGGAIHAGGFFRKRSNKKGAEGAPFSYLKDTMYQSWTIVDACLSSKSILTS